MAQVYFTRESFGFLKELKAHNEKAWFEANKERFELGLRQPGLKLVCDIAPVLEKVSKHFLVDPRPNGGSFSRIYRDTRFSKDKSPYKTALFFHFRHKAGGEDGAPTFYMHIEPGASTVGGGVWRPATPMLDKIRKAIVASPAAWDKAKGKSDVGATCMMGGETLKTVPRGYDPEHKHAEDLKRKDFGISQKLSDATIVGDALVAELGKSFRATAPFIAFLCKAMELPF